MVLEPITVKQIAKHLDVSPNKLYYHINLLEKHGLIRVVDTQLVSGIVEKHYRVSAEDITVADGLLSVSEPEGEDRVEALITTVLDTTKEELIRSMKLRSTEESRQIALFLKEMAMMPKERAKEFSKRLQDLIKEFTENDADTENVQSYALLAIFYPSFRLAKPQQSEEFDE
jgi:predicted ArsR family transcriptional regulator